MTVIGLTEPEARELARLTRLGVARGTTDLAEADRVVTQLQRAGMWELAADITSACAHRSGLLRSRGFTRIPVLPFLDLLASRDVFPPTLRRGVR